MKRHTKNSVLAVLDGDLAALEEELVDGKEQDEGD